MFWQDQDTFNHATISPTVLDLSFEMHCPHLPVDHAYALSQAIQQILPWFTQLPLTGLHLIHGAASSHGWQRPTEPDSLLHLSKRTKLTLRLPNSHLSQTVQALTGQTLEVSGHYLMLGHSHVKPLHTFPVLLARHVIADDRQSEQEFLQTIAEELHNLEIGCRKALCGKTAYFKLPTGQLFTRSLMIADLPPEESLTLQVQGVGKGRHLGCGLFLPQKDIKAVEKG